MNQFEMKQLAYQSKLKSRALQVLLYLIDRANKEQTCFPAVSTIGRELHISISTVKRAMRELVETGYVKKESRFREGNRGQTSNLYTLYFAEQEKTETIQERKGHVEAEIDGKPDEEPIYKAAVSSEVECRKIGMVKMEVISVGSVVKDNVNQGILYFCVPVTGGGVQFDIALNVQFNLRLKGGKIVFKRNSKVSKGSCLQRNQQFPHEIYLPEQAALPP